MTRSDAPTRELLLDDDGACDEVVEGTLVFSEDCDPEREPEGDGRGEFPDLAIEGLKEPDRSAIEVHYIQVEKAFSESGRPQRQCDWRIEEGEGPENIPRARDVHFVVAHVRNNKIGQDRRRGRYQHIQGICDCSPYDSARFRPSPHRHVDWQARASRQTVGGGWGEIEAAAAAEMCGVEVVGGTSRADAVDVQIAVGAVFAVGGVLVGALRTRVGLR